MALVMTIKPVMGNNINFPVELRFSTQFFEFINNQSDSDKEILEKGFHIEEFGKKSIIKCCFLREALIKLLSFAETENKLFYYSFAIKDDLHSGGGGRGISGAINGKPAALIGGVGQCWLEWYQQKDDNEYEYFCYKKDDISNKKEIVMDKLGVILILKKKANKLFELPVLKQLLKKLETYSSDDDFEIIIG